MKKYIFLTSILLISVLVGRAQSKESLGDRAMAAGNYAQAVQYYNEAATQDASATLMEKMNKASVLKGEFEAIDAAVASRNADELELHIQNVLMIDPDNEFIAGKRKQLSDNKVQHRSNVLRRIFLGSDDRQNNFSFLTIDNGLAAFTTPLNSGLQDVGTIQRVSYKFMSSFPVMIDFKTQLGLKTRTSSFASGQKTFGFGLGSCVFLGDYCSLDYGGGLQWNKMQYRNYETSFGFYYRAGLTYMFDNGMGLSYTFYRNIDEDVAFNNHTVSLIFGISQYAQNDGAGKMMLGGVWFAWSFVASLLVLKPFVIGGR